MKHFNKTIGTNKALAVLMAICMMFACVGTTSTTAFAASDNALVASVTSLNNTVYYPTDNGPTSGVFTGVWSKSATFNLPAGTIQISYSYESASSADYIVFSGPEYVTAKLTVHNGNQANTSVKLEKAGTYKVYIGSTTDGSEKIFAYTLYTK